MSKEINTADDKKHIVAVLMNTTSAVNRALIYGIIRYVKTYRPWHILLFPSDYASLRQTDFHQWNVQGIIADVYTDEVLSLIRSKNVPMLFVNPSQYYLKKKNFNFENISRIQGNSVKMGEMAADFFLERHFRNFAYIRDRKNVEWSQEREKAFTEQLAQAGYECQSFQPEVQCDDRGVNNFDMPGFVLRQSLGRWLKALPKPVALFAASDMYGTQAIDTCRQFNLRCPEEVAILGVDNDTILCEKTFPALSSIARNDEEAGFEGMNHLVQRITGQTNGPAIISIEPTAIIQRHSTFFYDIQDPVVIQAVNYIITNSDRNLRVDQIARELNVSRRLLEINFRQYLGQSVHETIKEHRINIIKKLLTETKMTVNEIAVQCEFSSEQYLSQFFKKFTGKTINQFRFGIR